MKIFNNYKEVAEFIGCKYWEVEEADNKYIGRTYFQVNGIELFKHFKNNKIHYIKINQGDNEDCKKYFMEYERHEYTWLVYVDDIEGWQRCEVLNVENNLLGIIRATVVTPAGTKLNRRVKFALDEEDEDFRQDGCIYFIEK